MSDRVRFRRTSGGIAFLGLIATVGFVASSPVGGATALLGLGLGSMCVLRMWLKVPPFVVSFAVLYGMLVFGAGCVIWRLAPPVDGIAYVEAGEVLAQNHLVASLGVSDVVLVPGKSGYVYMLGVLFIVFGTSAYVAVALNGVLMAWTMICIYKSGCALEIRRPEIPLWLLIGFPGLILWAAPPLREAPVLFCIAVMMWSGIELARGPRRTAIWSVFLASLLGVVFLRGPLVLALVPAVALGGIVAGRGVSRIGMFLMSTVAGAVAYVLASAPLQSIFARADRGAISVSQVELSNASSGFPTRPGPVGTLEAVGRVLLGPFPWEVSAAGIAVLEAPVWILLSWLAFRSVRRVGTRLGVPAAMWLALALVIAISVGNYGTMLRMRLSIIPCLVVVAGAGLSASRNKARVESNDAVR